MGAGSSMEERPVIGLSQNGRWLLLGSGMIAVSTIARISHYYTVTDEGSYLIIEFKDSDMAPVRTRVDSTSRYDDMLTRMRNE